MSEDNMEMEFDVEVEAVSGETKQQAFLRLANHRLPIAVKRIRMISNLANTNNYEYTEHQRNTLIRVLEVEVERLKEAFSGMDDSVPTIQ